MSRSSWTIQTKSGSWGNNGTIYRPNENFSLIKTSTQKKVSLANGDNAYVTPSIKYLNEVLSMTWFYDDGTTKNQIEGYITNQTDLKIIDHNANEYVGRFISIEAVLLVGEEPDMYDVKATFERMPGLS